MKIEYTQCDGCGKKIEAHQGYRLSVMPIGAKPIQGGKESMKKDICDECYQKFLEVCKAK